MKCKKHLADLSSSVGVCASCLRERLFILLAAQAEAQALAQAQAQEDHRPRKFDTQPAALVFPRSVSPYISRRKSDNSSNNQFSHHLQHSVPDPRFYSTPQVGPGGDIVVVGSLKKKYSRFSIFSRLFRSKSEKVESEPRVWDSREPTTAASSSPSWFSNVLSGRQKRQSRLCSTGDSTAPGNRRISRYSDRGMSPARHSDEEEGQCQGGSSGYSSESSQGWRKTPRATPSVKRGGGKTSHNRNMSGLAFCLSPLVRASPSRHWSQKGMTSDIGLSGEIRVTPKSHHVHLSNAASFCKNRSRKLADFGRSSVNR